MIEKPKSEISGALRHLAEERLASTGAESSPPPVDANLARLVHELQVHQMELELQNEELIAARAELEAHAEQFTEHYDFAPVGYLSVDVDGNIQQLNLLAARMLGKERTRLLGVRFQTFVKGSDEQVIQDFITQTFLDEMAVPCEVEFLPAGKSPITVRLTGALSPNGRACRMAATDITVRTQAETAMRLSEQQFRSIVEHSPTAMYLYQHREDGELIMIEANPAAEREIGIEHRSLIGKTIEAAFPKLAGSDTLKIFKAVAKGDLRTQSFVMSYDDEQITGHFEVHAFAIGPGILVVAFQNIKDRVETEARLLKVHAELESRVLRRTAQLQGRTIQLRALAAELTMAEERERRRIASLIHDNLQQMLVAALMNLRILKSNPAAESELEDLSRIETILSDSIETTRSLTVEISPPVLHQCGLAAAFHWLHYWLLEKYGLDVAMNADEGMDPSPNISVTLFHCVRELLFNTVKHSGVKAASVSMSQPVQKMLKIEVSDQGVGFDPDVVRAREGTAGGFGLFNIRERIELLGGRMESRSAPGCGSTFTLWVPMRAALPATERPTLGGISEVQAQFEQATLPGIDLESPPAVGHLQGKVRLVVADDHSDFREGLVRMLQMESDFEVVGQAADGHEALHLAYQLNPDFIIMDINMPQMNGIEATTAIRKNLRAVKVLGLSTHTDEQHRISMIRAGAIDLLHKNCSPALLIATLREPWIESS
ncbi:MAG: response regulator [Luteolibacter sp.]